MEKEWFDSWFDTPYYHTLYKNRNFEEADYFLNNLCKYLQPNTSDKILDLACGKGRHAVTLNKKGLNVIGVDLSEQSIIAAKNFENDTLHFNTHDMRNPLPYNDLKYIFNLFTSFGYFDSMDVNKQVLQHLYNALKEDGLIVIDFMNATKVINNLVKAETKTIDNIQFNITRKVANGQIIKNIDFTDQGKDFHFEEKVQAITLKDFQMLSEASNLKIIEYFGDYSLQPFEETTSDRLILIIKKAN